jgi:hypothetical protein
MHAADNDDDIGAMLAIAAHEPEVVGVVAWAPLDDPARTAQRIAALAASPRFVGIRVLIHDMADRDWIVRPGPDAGLAVLAAHHVPFDYVTADPTALTPDDLRPIIDSALDIFRPRRPHAGQRLADLGAGGRVPPCLGRTGPDPRRPARPDGPGRGSRGTATAFYGLRLPAEESR